MEAIADEACGANLTHKVIPEEPAPLAPRPEDDLVARLRAGDEVASVQLVKRYWGPLLSTARRFLKNEEDARDAVQEAFIRAHQAIDGFEGGSTFSTWLHRILINNCLMKLRTRKRRREESIDELLPSFQEDGHEVRNNLPWSDTIADELCRKETCRLVRELIDQLPETYRTVLLLREIQETDIRDVAALLGVTENAVKIRLHRARQALRALLAPHLASRGLA